MGMKAFIQLFLIKNDGRNREHGRMLVKEPGRIDIRRYSFSQSGLMITNIDENRMDGYVST